MEGNWSLEEKKELPQKYNCHILLERGTIEQLKDKTWPNDAYIITYQVDNVSYRDLCRGTRVQVFDVYYDKFGKNAILDIDFGYGTTNPRMWGYSSKKNENSKKR